MNFCNIKTVLKKMRDGKMFILLDDKNRENEGDLVIAAEKVTPEAINFMATHGKGLICLAMASKLVEKLSLPLMTTRNESAFNTNFTISIEAREGVSTGISAFDRAKTILTAISDNVMPQDIVSPGHVFPICAREGGVLVRAGQTEGSVDLASLAGLKPAAVICEIMLKNGKMARLPDLKKFAKKYHLPLVTIKDLITYRLRYDKTLLTKVAETILPTADAGNFKMIAYENTIDKAINIALVKGKISSNKPTLVRVHSECFTGDVLGSKRCDCGKQLKLAMQMINKEKNGVILYLRQEGRGIGLANKIRAYQLQDHGLNTAEANNALGFEADLRDYGIGAQILMDLGVRKMRLLTNNPRKIVALDGFGLEVVERVALEVNSHPENINYLRTKKKVLGHLLNL